MNFKLTLFSFLILVGVAFNATAEQIPADSTKEKVQQKTLGEYLLVVGLFGDEMEALGYFNKLCNDDIPAHFYFDKPNGVYLIHVGRYYFLEDAKLVLSQNPYPSLTKTIKRVKAYPQE